MLRIRNVVQALQPACAPFACAWPSYCCGCYCCSRCSCVCCCYCCCCYCWCCYRPWLHIFLSYSTLIMVFRLVTKRCSQPQSPHLSLSPIPVYCCHPLDFLMKLLPCNWGRAGSGGTFNRYPVADAEVLALPAYQKPRERQRLDPVQVIYCTQT